ncbi:acyl-CoA N-acyltransferase [Aspergillus aurantiobrunneus]
MDNTNEFRVVPAQTAKHIATARRLFTVYAEWLNIDLSFQGYDSELDSLPGKYGPPHGELLLAYSSNNTPLGCVAIHSLNQDAEQSCEMKRLYVSPKARGMGLGTALVAAIVQRAKELGYKEMRLDTLPSRMQSAIQLYTRVGFVETHPYYETRMEETIFLALDLTQ